MKPERKRGVIYETYKNTATGFAHAGEYKIKYSVLKKPRLEYAGYAYCIDGFGKNKLRNWRCTSKKLKCKGRAILEKGGILVLRGNHTHPPPISDMPGYMMAYIGHKKDI